MKNRQIIYLFVCGVFLSLCAQINICAQPQRVALRDLPNFMYGVTVEYILSGESSKPPEKIAESIKALKIKGQKPFVRFVFQKKADDRFDARVEQYKAALEKLHDDAYIVGELLDSSAVKYCDVECYEARAKSFAAKLGHLVDIWEIGNEINGEWVLPAGGPRTTDEKNKEVGEKILRAYRAIKEVGGRTALTLYYNDDSNSEKRRHCWDNKENEMFYWAKNYVSPEIKSGLDYVFISYYDDPARLDGCRDNDTGEKLNPDWRRDFLRLNEAEFFPGKKLGFGECGTKRGGKKSGYIEDYYQDLTVNLTLPNYVGGYFWWFFENDMVSKNKPVADIRLLKKLIETIERNPRFFP